jgi:hypothetical protein
VSDLTHDEQERVRAAMRFLRVRSGGWKPLAKALGFKAHTVRHVKGREKNVSPTMALRVARLAGVSVDDLLVGRFPPERACPRCGYFPADGGASP